MKTKKKTRIFYGLFPDQSLDKRRDLLKRQIATNQLLIQMNGILFKRADDINHDINLRVKSRVRLQMIEGLMHQGLLVI